MDFVGDFGAGHGVPMRVQFARIVARRHRQVRHLVGNAGG